MFRRRIILHLRKISNPNHRYYSKISPIAEAFNARPNAKFNFMRKTETGLFGIRELRTHKGFHVLQSQCLEKTNDLIREALSDARYRKMVEIFDELSDSLCQVADLADFIRLAHPSMEFRHAAEYSCVSLSKIVEQLNTHASLYGILKEAVLRGDVKPTTEVDQLVGQLFLFDFEQSGIHLGETEREQVCVLNDVILNLGQSFVAGTDKPRKVDKYDIPETVRNVFAADGNDLLVSGLYVDSNNPLTREIAYKLFLHPDENQDMILMDLLKARHELAQVCGFHTYSERALRGGTLDTPSQVMEFLDTLSRGIGNYAQADFKLMQHMKNLESPSSGPLAAWDVPYFSLKAKRDWFNVSQKEYSPYFSLGACMDGLNCLFQRLYGITLVNSEVNDGECWSPDVYKLAVVSDTEGTLGYIYCDFYERTGKQNQDCHFTIRGGRQLPNGDYQTPIVVLMLNFAMPRWGTPSLLTPQMVDNLFHEMGHAMHSMLARTQYQHVTGTRCSTDFAEVPSVLMEFFASDPRVLRMFARHFQTNEPIPEDKLQRLCASKRLFTASETQLQLFYAALDQMYHGRHPLPGTTSDVLNDAQTKYYGLPYVGNTNWQLRFSHLVGYGAKYYSYLVSRALAYWIWQTYFERDPFSRAEGEKYRRECLAHGGGKNPKKLVADFLMFEPTPEILATSLLKEIADDQDIIQSAACNIASTK